MKQRPKILVSSCLLGNKVRFDGEGKPNNWMVDTLAKHVDFIPICPEMLMGLGSPREAMRLHRPVKKADIEMISSKSQTNLTEIALSAVNKAIRLVPADTDGIILMSNSPSCGLERVKVYDYNMSPTKTGVGFFAQKILQHFPQTPTIEVGRLNDLAQRHHYLTRLFVQFSFSKVELKISALQTFHAQNKYLIMAHAPQNVAKMGQLAANSQMLDAEVIFERYKILLFESLLAQPQLGRLKNALSHVAGYLKKQMTKEQKSYVQDLVTNKFDSDYDFVKTLLPIINYANLENQNDYLAEQTIFQPYPKELEVY